MFGSLISLNAKATRRKQWRYCIAEDSHWIHSHATRSPPPSTQANHATHAVSARHRLRTELSWQCGTCCCPCFGAEIEPLLRVRVSWACVCAIITERAVNTHACVRAFACHAEGLMHVQKCSSVLFTPMHCQWIPRLWEWTSLDIQCARARVRVCGCIAGARRPSSYECPQLFAFSLWCEIWANALIVLWYTWEAALEEHRSDQTRLRRRWVCLGGRFFTRMLSFWHITAFAKLYLFIYLLCASFDYIYYFTSMSLVHNMQISKNWLFDCTKILFPHNAVRSFHPTWKKLPIVL